MKRAALIFGVLFLVFTAIACDFAGYSIDLGGDSNSNGNDSIKDPPTAMPQTSPVDAGIDAPSSGTLLQMGPVDIAYHASSVEGVSVVELSIDGAVVSSIASPDASTKVVALRYTWNPPTAGDHTLQVRAQNKSGAWSNFATSAVSIQGVPPTAQPPTQQVPQATQAPQATNTPEPTKTQEATPLPDIAAIYDVKYDKNKFYYGSNSCGSKEITISAKVTKPEDVYSVVLFNRFFDNEGGGTSKWDAGHAMSKKSDGTYSITLPSNKITNYNMYEFAVMNYQMVATDKNRNNLARTEVFKDIQLNICP
jgi:hypothetical protein